MFSFSSFFKSSSKDEDSSNMPPKGSSKKAKTEPKEVPPVVAVQSSSSSDAKSGLRSTRTNSKEAEPKAPPKTSQDPSFNDARAKVFFDSLAESDDPEIIGMEGISKLCTQLNIDPNTDVRILVLMWKLGAISKPGCITRDECMKGLKKLNRSNEIGITVILPSLDPGFLDRNDFREFYRFVFQFSREGTHKTIEKDVVAALLPIVLSPQRAPHLNQFLEFLQTSTTVRVTLDQWDSFLQFNHIVGVDLKNYEDDGAWPLLLDEYIEWRRKNKA